MQRIIIALVFMIMMSTASAQFEECDIDEDCNENSFCTTMKRCLDVTTYNFKDSYCKDQDCGEGDGDCDFDLDCKGTGQENSLPLICGSANAATFHPKIADQASRKDFCQETILCEDDDVCQTEIGRKYYCGGDGMCHKVKELCDNPLFQCQIGDGDCDNDAQCGEGLICGRNNFLTFHPDVAGAKTKDDACVETVACAEDIECAEARGRKFFCADDGFCHRGSDYCSSARLINPEFKCVEGEGDCDSDDDCIDDLICADSAFSALHPDTDAPQSWDACVVPEAAARLTKSRVQPAIVEDNVEIVTNNPWFWGFLLNCVILSILGVSICRKKKNDTPAKILHDVLLNDNHI